LTLSIRCEPLEDGRPGVAIDVVDTGHGIPPEVLPKVMDAFFTTKEEGKGTGLGLAICRRIVHEHNGTIRIESAAGKGTTVRITLPASNGNNVKGLHGSK
jgi:signal transduction histidine kinase